MKVTKIKASLILALTAMSLTACGSLPSAMTSSVSSDGTGLSILATDAAASDAAGTAAGRPEGRGGKGGGHGMGDKGGPGGHGGPGGPGGFGFINPHQLASLNLTDDQKTQIAAIQAEAKTFMEANKPTADSTATRPDPEAARTAFETAFKSDTFDASSLTANAPARPVPSEAMLDFQVSQMVKLHGVLTAEQRAQLFAEPTTTPATRPSPPADAADRQTARLDDLATKLSLSADQKTQLATIFSSDDSTRQAEMEAHKAEHDAERAAFKNLLTADTVDSAALKALIQAQVAKAPQANQKFAQLEQIHALLTTEQRALWLTLDKGPGGPGGPGGHGGPGGPGGPGGHGGGRGGRPGGF